MNIAVMSVRQWYQALMSLDDQTPPHPLAPDPPLTVSPPCRVERLHPQQDWPNTWRLSRLRGLDSEQLSFLWKLLHGLLPLRARLHQLTPHTPPTCQLCSTEIRVEDKKEDSNHAFFTCQANTESGLAVLAAVRSLLPDITAEQVLRLDIATEESLELPVVWLITEALGYIWKQRSLKNKTLQSDLKTHLTAKLTFLSSVHPNAVCQINNMTQHL